jgi:hypothetical protein
MQGACGAWPNPAQPTVTAIVGLPERIPRGKLIPEVGPTLYGARSTEVQTDGMGICSGEEVQVHVGDCNDHARPGEPFWSIIT